MNLSPKGLDYLFADGKTQAESIFQVLPSGGVGFIKWFEYMLDLGVGNTATDIREENKSKFVLQGDLNISPAGCVRVFFAVLQQITKNA